MAQNSNNALAGRHAVSLDIGKARMAKADAQKVGTASEAVDWPLVVGAAVQRAVSMAGLSNKEAAAVIGVDAADFGKWISGERRPQFDKLMAVESLRWPLICALADVSGTASLVMTIRRRA